jgi:hypothetical protein
VTTPATTTRLEKAAVERIGRLNDVFGLRSQ